MACDICLNTAWLHQYVMQYGYRMGKAALHIAGVTLARDFKKVGIPVGLIHPGVVSQAAKRNVSWSMQVNKAWLTLRHDGAL